MRNETVKTTVELEATLLYQAKRRALETRSSLKEVINQALRIVVVENGAAGGLTEWQQKMQRVVAEIDRMRWSVKSGRQAASSYIVAMRDKEVSKWKR